MSGDLKDKLDDLLILMKFFFEVVMLRLEDISKVLLRLLSEDSDFDFVLWIVVWKVWLNIGISVIKSFFFLGVRYLIEGCMFFFRFF